jgi:energy-coupling factor transporter ATP-binding protein EcfA2
MRVAKLRIEGFRGIRNGEFALHQRTAIVGPNGCGKSTIVDALSLVLGKSRMVRNLTEHDFTGSCPTPSDRFRILATLTDFSSEEPGDHPDWFRMGRAVPKWIDPDGMLHSSSANGRRLAGQLGFAARFDHEDLTVETVRYFHDDDDVTDPFADEVMLAQIPIRLLAELGYFVLPARRTWEGVTSFNSELFRRTVSDVAGIPSSEILQQRDDLRSPAKPLESSPAIGELVERLDKKLASLMVQKPRFRLRVTSGDSEAVLQAMLPHYATDTATLPASRQGMGLVSLQSLLLLLEVGRSRKEKGLPFILALEEPELHLAPGVQVRLVAEAAQIADQVICATHSPRVAASFAATDIFVMSASNSSAVTVPFLAKPLDASATNNDRKLFVQNRVRVLDSLMHSVVLVPEGRFDAEWLSRLADIAETPSTPPFGTVCGIAPTENAAVAFTTRVLRTLRPGVVAVVDGDADGGAYALALAALSNRPEAIVQWPVDWTIENVVGWIVAAGGPPAIARIQSGLGSSWKVGTVAELVNLLRTPNDVQEKVFGLKEDIVAHEVILDAIRQVPACVARASEVCECLVRVALVEPHPRALLMDPQATLKQFRFDAG